MVASQQGPESQIEALLPGSDPDEYVKGGVTLFTYFRLQYWYNKYPHRWPIAHHECLQSVQARRSFTRKWIRAFSSLKEPESNRCVRFLLSRFDQAELPACSGVGRREFFTLVHALLQSKLPYEDHFAEGAMFFQSREKNVAVLQFPLEDMPSPPLQPQNLVCLEPWHRNRGIEGNPQHRQGVTDRCRSSRVAGRCLFLLR